MMKMSTICISKYMRQGVQLGDKLQEAISQLLTLFQISLTPKLKVQCILNIAGLDAANIPDQLQQGEVILEQVNPTSKDWRDNNAITSIKNQLNCGSCWSFASAAYSESRLIIQGKENINIDFSEQFILKCTQ